MLFHNLHPPDEVRIFEIPEAAVRVWDDTTFVYDVPVGDRVLRHFSFYDEWFEINCTLTSEGAFAFEDGPIPWTFNCDICTPCFSVGSCIYNVDLFLDVLVGPDGRSFHVKDEADFTRARSAGWLSDDEQDGVRQGLDRLCELIDSGNLLEYLSAIIPFDDIQMGEAGGREDTPLRDVPLLQLPERTHRHGVRE